MNKYFIDTNVLIYAYSNDEPEKNEKANEVIFTDNTLISLQVINEFSNTCLRKLKITPQKIISSLEEISNIIKVTAFTHSTQIKALQLINKYNFSYYDSLIIATAIENACTILYSEDMQHKQKIENQLTILNPFI